MKFQCHKCKKEVEDLSELSYRMDKNGFTYSYCKNCLAFLEPEQK